MYWELWDVKLKNLVADFATEGEALQAVREMLAVNRPDYIDDLALAAMYDEGEPRDVELPPALRGAELQARLGEITQADVADAARSVHERIRKWLAEENWDVYDMDDPQSSFHITVMLEPGLGIRICQMKTHFDHVMLFYHWSYPDDVRSIISRLPEEKLQEAVWNAYRDASVMGVEFIGLDTPSTQMTLRTYVYFDGLTKDTLIQRARLTVLALKLAGQTLRHALDTHDRSVERTPSAEDLDKIVRFMPSASHPLTAAS